MRETESLEPNKRMDIALLSLLAWFILPPGAGAVCSAPGVSGELRTLISQGVDLTLKQDYNSADSVFRIASERFPSHPYGNLYRAAVMEAKSIDNLDPLDFPVFDSLITLAKSQAEQMIELAPNSALGYYLRGTAIGFDAYAQVDAGNWLGGIVKGLSAATDLKKTLELDSSFYDAYAGVGTYYYWKSKKAEFLNWALGDRRTEGIRLLEIAAEKSENNKFAALSALTAIYLDTGQSNLAIESARRALARYPENRVFLWGLASGQDQAGSRGDAIQTYERLLKNILDAKISNPYNEISCRMNIVKAKLALNQTEGVSTQLDAILAFDQHKFPETLATRAKNKFEEARNIREKLVVR